jgi:CHAT domain-containing protein
MDAAPASLVSAAAEGAAILHVVCHGVYDDSRERGALLALAPAPGDDGLVDCEEVEVMPGTARLVILSACGAARGPRRVGDDALTHLGGAFLEAGARAVVVSARPVELRATTRLMVAFHRALARGAPTAAALRDARRELASDADPLDAFHLAQFEVLGLGSAPVLR